MARSAAKPTAESVAAHLASGNVAAAVVAARMIYQDAPNDASLKLYQDTLIVEVGGAIDRRNLPLVVSILGTMERLPQSYEWNTRRAVALAQTGQLTDALLLQPDQEPLILAHAADHAVRHQRFRSIPSTLQADVEAVLAAFVSYEAGRDDEAKEKLQAIPLASPLMDWKLLLRGLIAHTAGNDELANENWKRLDATRFPHRLAKSIQTKPHEGINESRLRAAMGAVNTSERLSRGWERIGLAWEALEGHDDLRERLAEVVYHAIYRQGQPEDLKRYLKLFGPPPGDPDFHRLQALVMENQSHMTGAIAFWEKFDAWLASQPAVWPAAQIPRARAMTLHHMAQLASEAAVGPLANLFGMFGSKALSPLDYLAKAAKADPACVTVRDAALRAKLAAHEFDGLDSLARETLALDPNNVAALEAMGWLSIAVKDYAANMDYRFRALKANPLDEELNKLAARAVLSAIRAADDVETMRRLFDEHRDLCGRALPMERELVGISLARKLGKAVEVPLADNRLAQAFILSVDAVLMKLKPAQRTAANKLYTERLKDPDLLDVLILRNCANNYHMQGFEYRGSKSIDKKIESLLIAAAAKETNIEVVIRLMDMLEESENDKLILTVCEPLAARFPQSPHVKFMLATGLMSKRSTRALDRRIMTLLIDARRLAEAQGFPELVDEIDAARGDTNLDDILDHFGGPR